MIRFILSVCALCLLAFTAAAQSYRVQPGDILEVTVLEDANLNRTTLVRPDGRITLPIAGSINAGGQTPEAIARTVTARLRSNFAIEPTVTVSVARLAEPKPVTEEEVAVETISVFFMGQVNRPGGVEMEKGTTLLQGVALSGGLTRFAATRRIQLRRTDPKTNAERIVVFNYRALEGGAYLNEQTELLDGDVIIVPERGLFEF